MSVDLQTQLDKDGWEIYEFTGPWRLLNDLSIASDVQSYGMYLNTFLENRKLFYNVLCQDLHIEDVLDIWSLRAHKSRWFTIMALLSEFHHSTDVEHLMLCYVNDKQTSKIYMGQTRMITFYLDNNPEFDIQKALLFRKTDQDIPTNIMEHSQKVDIDYIENKLNYKLHYRVLEHFLADETLLFAHAPDRDFDLWDSIKYRTCGNHMRSFFHSDSQERIKFLNPEIYDCIILDQYTRGDDATWTIEIVNGEDPVEVYHKGYIAYAIMLCALNIEHDNGIVRTTKLREPAPIHS